MIDLDERQREDEFLYLVDKIIWIDRLPFVDGKVIVRLIEVLDAELQAREAKNGRI